MNNSILLCVKFPFFCDQLMPQVLYLCKLSASLRGDHKCDGKDLEAAPVRRLDPGWATKLSDGRQLFI